MQIPKIEIKDQRANIQKILDLLIKKSVKLNDVITLKAGESVTIRGEQGEDGKSAEFKFLDPKPYVVIDIPIFKDPVGKLSRIVVSETSIMIDLDGLPDVTVPVVS